MRSSVAGGVLVSCMMLRSALRAGGRAVSTTAGRRQLPAQRTDQHPVATTTKTNFSDVQRVRHEQAKHSVLITCPAKINENSFLKYLSQFGEVANHFFFEGNGCHAVVEFVDLQSIESLLSRTSMPIMEDVFIVPYKSRFIKVKTADVGQQYPNYHPLSAIPISEFMERLCNAKNIEDQAHLLLEELQLTEESIRLRYLVSTIIGDVATALFPEATLHLYGSSVNSFGKLGCDLDLFLNLEYVKGFKPEKKSAHTAEFWMRQVSSGRKAQQRILSVIAECLDGFGPGCNEVQKILNARCPLVRFNHQASDLRCDLTADNKIALRTSELLYTYGYLDHRVRALVFTLRCWARVHGITSSISGHWITNFSITIMVIFFLQKRKPPVIPTLNYLKSITSKKDRCIIDGINCTFGSDFNKIKTSKNREPFDKLLMELLEFYGSFDFKTSCIDICKGIEMNKPEAAPLYIQNPFEQMLNISKNVNQSQVERFVDLAQESALILQSHPTKQSNGEDWGLATILRTNGLKTPAKAKNIKVSQQIDKILDSLKDNDTGGSEAPNQIDKILDSLKDNDTGGSEAPNQNL